MDISFFKKIFLFFLLFSSLGVTAQENESSYDFGASFEHYLGFYTDVDPESKISLSLGLKLNESSSLNFIQGVTKYYVKNIGESELGVDDFSIYYNKTVTNYLKLRLGATLPISERSQQSGLVSRLSFKIKLSQKIFSDKITISYSPFSNFYYNKYTFDNYGKLMTKWGIGNSLVIGGKVSKKFSIYVVGSAGINFKENTGYKTADDDNSDNGFYSFDLSASYAVTDNIGIRAGYSQGDAQIREGVRETYFFDQYNSLYYFATDISF